VDVYRGRGDEKTGFCLRRGKIPFEKGKERNRGAFLKKAS